MTTTKLAANRRTFLKVGLVGTAGLAVGLGYTFLAGDEPSEEMTLVSESTTGSENPDEMLSGAWITIHADERVEIVVNHSEMGQAITTAFPMIVAEEMDADWSKVSFTIAPVADVYKHPHYGIQWTVSSRSVESGWAILRRAGASVRQLMIGAAAETWGVTPRSCTTANGAVHHRQTGKSLSYGKLIAAASKQTLPKEIPLKHPEEFTLIGKPTRRLDSWDKISGKAVFGADIRLPGMLLATVLHPPVFGARPEKINILEVQRLRGVRRIVVITTGVAVIADSFYHANFAMQQLEVQWEPIELAKVHSEELDRTRPAKAKQQGKVVYQLGETKELLEKAEKVFEASYDLPYQAHATPEPMNCTADVRGDRCDIWVPTQNQEGAREIAAKITGLPVSSIRVNTTFLGGGFGRRALVDYVGEAVELSMAMKTVVQVVWTREEDIKCDRYRPSTHNVLMAAIDNNGLPSAWLHRIVGADVFGQVMPEVVTTMLPDKMPRFVKSGVEAIGAATLPRIIPGKKATVGAAPLPYNLQNVQVEFIDDDPGIPLGWWRSVAHSSNCFAVECFVDELAAFAGRDPYSLRCELLRDNPRLLAVVKIAAQKSGWHEGPRQGRFRGMACHDFQGTLLAMVAEISIDQQKSITVHAVDCAVDCGVAVNPRTISAQLESAIAFGLTATLKSEITIKNGAVEQSNFDDFPLLRYNEMPEVNTHIISSNEPPTGIGEAGVPVIGPAVANAVFAATGKPVRRLPIRL